MAGSSRAMLGAPFPEVTLTPKPPLGPNSPFQGWQKIPTSGDSNANANANANEKNSPSTGADASGFARARPNLDHYSEEPIMDSRKRRMASNRLSAQRSRQKKTQYLANLEFQAKTYEAEIAELQPELASYQNQKHSLVEEHEKLEQQLASLEKETLLKDEIELSKEEVNHLRELHTKKREQLRALMPNWNNNAVREPISQNYPNTYQAEGNVGETGHMNVDIPPTQNQMWVPAELNVPNSFGSMEMNLISDNALNPYNFQGHF